MEKWARASQKIMFGVGLAVLSLFLGAAAPRVVPPSIVVIVTDDQRWDTLQYMPRVQRDLVGKGVAFQNGFLTTSLCCPSRASILTGQYAHNHGVLTNRPPNGGVERFHDASTVATMLRAAGYRTGFFGKYLNGYQRISPYIPPGWDKWTAFVREKERYFNYSLNINGTIVAYDGAASDYSTSVIARHAVDFIENNPTGPLFIYWAPHAMHGPAIPHPRDAGKFSGIPPWRPSSYNEEDVSDKPLWIRNLRPLSPTKQERGDALRQRQLETLLAVDRAVADLLAALSNTGRLGSTAIFFIGDNGLTWGEHRLLNKKGCPYEECIRAPFVAVVPGVSPRSEARFALNIDIAPTLAELAGVSPPVPPDGVSLLPLLRNQAPTWRTDFLVEEFTAGRRFDALRNARWTYVEYGTGERELYDLDADPYQLQSLSSDPAYEPLMAQLHDRLQQLKGQ